MTHRGGAVWTERLFLILILASLGGTLNLVLTMHRRVATADLQPKFVETSPTATSAPIAPASDSASTSASPAIPDKPVEAPSPPIPPPATPVEDPTIKALAGLSRSTSAEIIAAQESDRQVAVLETARKAAVAESERWKRRELLVKQQITKLSQKAARLEQQTSELDAERDVLARERDALKAALTRAGQQSGNAILPYKGPNGTWRRPIVIECVGNVAKLQPEGRTFSMLELSPLINSRSSPIVLAIAREMMRIDRAGTPDGSPVVPYLVFLVRPSGIRPYYEVRARLEPLGIAFGYELVEQELVVDVPDYDDLSTWDGSKPLDPPEIGLADAKARPAWPSSAASDSQRRGRARGSAVLPPEDSGASGAWPASRDGGGAGESGSGNGGRGFAQNGRPGTGPDGSGSVSGPMPGGRPTGELALGGLPGRGNGPGGAGSGEGSPDDFVWPSNSRGAGSRANPDANANTPGTDGGPGMGDSPGAVPDASGSPGSPGFGPYTNDLAGGPASGGSLASAPPVGNGSRTGSSTGPSGGAFGRPAGFAGPSTGSMSGGQRGLGSASGSSSASGVGVAPGPNPGGRSGGATRSGSGPTRNSFGPGGPDVLPDLEPARDGTGPSPPASGGPMSGSSSSGVAAGSHAGFGANREDVGSAGGGPTGLGVNAGGGGTTAAGGQSPGSGSEGGGQSPPRGSGSTASDPGFAPYPGGATAAGGPGDVQGSSGSNPPAAATDPSAGGPSLRNEDNSQDVGQPPPNGSPSSNHGLVPYQGAVASGVVGTGDSRGRPPTGAANSAPWSHADAASPNSGPSGSTATGSGTGSIGSPSTSPFSPSSSASGSNSSSTSGSPSNSLSSGDSQSTTSAVDPSMASMFASGETSSSSSSSGGQPGAAGTPMSQGMSLPSLSINPDPSSEPDGLKEFAVPSIARPDRPARAIEVPFEIVVVCRRNDVLLHPGGWRLTTKALREGAGKGDGVQDSLLKQELRAVVRRRAQIDPLIRPKPSVKFLVEADGATTYSIARQQLVFSGLDWPMSLQVAGPQGGHVFNRGTSDAVNR